MKFLISIGFVLVLVQICAAQNTRFIVDVVSYTGDTLTEQNFNVLCRGTIVNNLRHVLTPASCVQPFLNPLRIGIVGRVTFNATHENIHLCKQDDSSR